jgi:hypothetical protein
MNSQTLYWLVGIVLVVHVLLAFATTSEVKTNPSLTRLRKVLWLAMVWLFPVIGSVLAHTALGLKWGSVSMDGHDPTGGTGGYDGND